MNWFKRQPKLTTPEEALKWLEDNTPKPKYPRRMYGSCPICGFERNLNCPSEDKEAWYSNYVNGLCGQCGKRVHLLTPILERIINEVLDERQNLRSILLPHITDLRACAELLRSPQWAEHFANTAAEMEKAAKEIEEAL